MSSGLSQTAPSPNPHVHKAFSLYLLTNQPAENSEASSTAPDQAADEAFPLWENLPAIFQT